MVARNRVVISGNLGLSGQEQWSTGFTVAPIAAVDPMTDPNQLSEWADDVMAILRGQQAGAVNLRGLLSTSASITDVTTYYYPAAGPAVAVGQSATAAIVGTGTIKMPPQIAVVFSLLTGVAGRSFRGRMYWPALAGTIDSGMDMEVNVPFGHASGMAEVLGLIRDAGFPSGGHDVAVYSATRDLVTPVTRIGVGSAYDTQRRRREGLVEAYAYQPMTAPGP